MSEWKCLLAPDILAYMQDNATRSVSDLGLQKFPSDWNKHMILDQIKARQKAGVKYPEWLGHDDFVFPSADTMEQASSYATAHYKKHLLVGETCADLTAGSGIDAFALAQNFDHFTCVELDSNTAGILEHNAGVLGLDHVDVVCGSAEDFVRDMDFKICIYIDPQRRSDLRAKLRRFGDCSPDIAALIAILKGKTDKIVIKASPMLDISQAVHDLGGVSDIHIIEYKGECKEVLYILDFQAQIHDNPRTVPIIAVNIDDDGTVIHSYHSTAEQDHVADVCFGEPLQYLYEPSPAFMKMGTFNKIGFDFQLLKLHVNTHLYTSSDHIDGFPGYAYQVQGIYQVKRGVLPISKANLKTRNFPSDVKALYKKLRLESGGDDMVFATTVHSNQKMLIHCGKIR